MKDEQYLFIENTLRELAMYIHNCRVSEEKEKFKKQFAVVYDSTLAPMRSSEVSKPNKKKRKQSLQVWTAKEIKDMPYLKDIKYRKTQNGIHQFRYRRDGYNVSFNSKDFEVAKKKAYDFIKGLKKILRNSADVAFGKTLDFVAQAWLELKKAHTVPATFRTYKGVYDNHIAPVFGKRSVKSILPMDLQPYFDDLFSRQERTCEDAKVILNGIFEYAVANRLIPSNPMQGVIVNKHFRKTGKALTNEQIETFKKEMLKHGPYGIAGLIILYSGVRGHELNSIDFQWDRGVFVVNNAKLKKGQKSNPENLKRTVPIFPGLWKLKDLIQKSEEWRIKPTSLTVYFSKNWEQNSVKDLRHTFTTKAQQAGVPENLVNLWTGHLPGKTVTANVYTHFDVEYQIQQANKITNY
ncbi:MAG: tyrosine-type recombinase/integrase family protein [Clostridia bacterium]|nr:tyrosine-type recombinase/integrase family protein [Clostridia bacterium]